MPSEHLKSFVDSVSGRCDAYPSAGDPPERITHFLTDRGTDTYLGKRRVSREDTVQDFAELAASLGYSVSIYPDISGRDIIMFRDWVGNGDDMAALRRARPNVDILFGQDLCHQVPAVVRFRM